MKKNKQHPVKQLILQGEGMHLDFKFEISDAAKIARSLVAFANTDGGTLLVGVKDNGKIAGIHSEEEYYMIENAAKRYCKPEVAFTTKEWTVEGKKILEVNLLKSKHLPHKAPDKNGRYKAYIRRDDENLLANGVQMKIWKKQKRKQNIRFTYGEKEKLLLELLKKQPGVSLSCFVKKSGLSHYQAENMLANFVLLGLAQMCYTPLGIRFFAADPLE
jgi:predicted HTH transcriptional regulator